MIARPVLARRDEHAVARGGRERNRDDDLRVVPDARCAAAKSAQLQSKTNSPSLLPFTYDGATATSVVARARATGAPATQPVSPPTQPVSSRSVEPRVLDERRAVLAEERVPASPRDVADALENAKRVRGRHRGGPSSGAVADGTTAARAPGAARRRRENRAERDSGAGALFGASA